MADLAQTRALGTLGPDDMLVPISCIQWVAANAFCVTVPLLRARLLFELTAVDVPRTQRKDVLETITRVLAAVNGSPRAFVRLDHVQSFPTEAFADVIYLLDEPTLSASSSPLVPEKRTRWCSLQEGLLQHGVGILSRPCGVRLGSLLAAERHGADQSGPDDCQWLHQTVARERSSSFNATARCRVVDVVRGDVFVVEWLPSSSERHDPLQSPPSSQWPRLLILDAIVCLAPSTLSGRRALRWSQQHVLHATLTVTVHSREPLDKDVSLSTQLDTLEQLASVRGAAYVESTKEDVAEALLRARLAKLRCALDACAPRPSNFLHLLHVIDAGFGAEMAASDTCSADCDGRVAKALRQLWQLPAPLLGSLFAFHGRPWTTEVTQHCAAELGIEGANSVQDQAGPVLAGLTARLWSRYVWCGSTLTDSWESTDHLFIERSLRSLCSLQTLLHPTTPPFRGLVSDVSVVSARDDTRALLLQVEVNLVAPVSQWVAIRGTGGGAGADLFLLDPPPRSEPYPARKSLEVSITCDISLLPWREGAFLSIQVKAKSLARTTTGETGDPEAAQDDALDITRLELPDHHAMITLPAPVVTCPVQEYEVTVRCLSAESEDATTLAEITTHYWLRTALSADELNEPSLIEDAAETLLELRADGGNHEAGATSGDAEDQGSELFSSSSDDDDEDAPQHGADGDAAADPATQDAGDAAPPAADTSGTERAVVCAMEPHYFAKVLLFFALPPSVTVDDVLRSQSTTTPAPSVPAETICRLARDLLHRDVLVLFAARATVNGVRGMLGDLFFSSCSPQPDLVEDALSGTLTTQPRSRFPHSLLDALSAAHDESAAPPATSVEAWPSAEAIRAALSRKRLSDAQTHTPADAAEPARPVDCHVVIGQDPLWVEHETDTRTLPVLWRGTFSPYVSLALFSLRPRQLFCGSTNNQHRIVEKEQRTGEDDSVQNIDWAIMRLPFQRLPNLMTANLELLPSSLRNVERAYCRQLMARAPDPVAPLLSPPTPTEPVTAPINAWAAPDAPLPPLHGEESSTARVLALLLLLMRGDTTPSQDTGGQAVTTATSPANVVGAEPDAATAMTYQLLSQRCSMPESELKPTLTTEVVLYLLPRRGEQTSAGSGTWFLGSRDAPSSDLFEDSAEADNIAPDTVPHPFHRYDMRRVVATMGREALTESAVEAWPTEALAQVQLTSEQLADDVCPLTHKGLGPFPSRAHTRRLYHPADGVHMLGLPLVVHTEVASEHLAELMARRDASSETPVAPESAPFTAARPEVPQSQQQQRLIGVEYVPVYLARNRKPYKLFSYGRIGRAAIGELQRLRSAFGGDVVAYLTLLLRQSCHTEHNTRTPLPDGQLYVYGVASEPLYAHYRSRLDLRFSLGTYLPIVRDIGRSAPPDNQGTADSTSDESHRERQLLQNLCGQLRRILQRVTDKLAERRADVRRVFLQWVAHLDEPRPYIALLVYPVDDGETLQRSGAAGDKGVDAYQGNPHRPFSTGYGVVRHRLPLGELRITYSRAGADGADFSTEWLGQLEPAPEPQEL